jgi:alpha-1,6-mannosyltransferase
MRARPALRPVPIGLAGAVGLAGSVCVLIGVVQPGSPFRSQAASAWFFGTGPPSPAAGADARLFGIVLVYAGVALLVGSWFELVRTLRRTPDTGLRRPVAIAAAWAAPVLVMPPMFSRDVYSYAAQGELVRRGINPYSHTPSALGRGPYFDLVDPLWRHAPAPYGPAFERLSGWVVGLSGHSAAAAVVGFRCMALIGVVLIAWGVPVLAQSVGRSGTVAFALAVLNPAVLLVLLGGAQNDALMLGLLVAGCALARRGRVLAGLALCALAAEVKIPALLGAVCIGWWWGAQFPQWRRRIPRVGVALLTTVGLMAVIGAVSGLGWRWLSGLSNPGTVVSWLDPATAVGLLLGHAAGALGAPGHSHALVQGARAAGLAVAAVVSLWLILRSDRVGELQALGWSLLVFVVLGPVVWPWYETWGFVVLAVVAEGWTLRLLLALSAVACFADVPGTAALGGADPAFAILCWIVLLGGIIAYVVARLVPSLSHPVDPQLGRRIPGPGVPAP